MRQSVLAFGCVVGFLGASCSSDVKNPAGASVLPVSTPARSAEVSASGAECPGAAPDVVVGNAALVIDRLRMDRQNAVGASVLRQYACFGNRYRINAGETIELWAEASGAAGPRLRVDWGSGEPDSPDATGCGSCLLRHTYRSPGVYTVRVTLDDRLSTTVTRTFVLDSTDPVPPVATATVSIACSGAPALRGPAGPSFGIPSVCSNGITVIDGAAGSLTGSGFNCSSTSGGTCGPLTVPIGTVITVTAQADGPTGTISGWQGACAGVGTGLFLKTGTCTFTVTGNTTLSVKFDLVI